MTERVPLESIRPSETGVPGNGAMGSGAPGNGALESGAPVADRQGVRPTCPSAWSLAIFDDHLRSFPLPDGTVLIGRSRANHLPLHDHLLSRKHCSLTRTGDQLLLADLNSSNGTYVNGERIGTRSLRTDDIVELGKTVLVVYDGHSWGRGEGLLNLRNPMKAQELVQRLREGGGRSFAVQAPATAPPRNGVRSRKGLEVRERAFLRWLEAGGSPLLAPLVTDYLTHKLVSLLVRNSLPVRAAFTAVLEEMMRPEFFQRFHDMPTLRAGIAELVQSELRDLADDSEPTLHSDRGLLEPTGEEVVAPRPTPDATPRSP